MTLNLYVTPLHTSQIVGKGLDTLRYSQAESNFRIEFSRHSIAMQVTWEITRRDGKTDATSSPQPGLQRNSRRSIIHLECESTNRQKVGDRPQECHLDSFSNEQW